MDKVAVTPVRSPGPRVPPYRPSSPRAFIKGETGSTRLIVKPKGKRLTKSLFCTLPLNANSSPSRARFWKRGLCPTKAGRDLPVAIRFLFIICKKIKKEQTVPKVTTTQVNGNLSYNTPLLLRAMHDRTPTHSLQAPVPSHVRTPQETKLPSRS
ncbi:hypothetical protein GRJ2_001416400 [Grus japonensis]|uniref:Uncharacterized protein n=1 Tax=Grus japonensis TaxID=30415 RepID=A0ABC9WW33_GRUJA